MSVVVTLKGGPLDNIAICLREGRGFNVPIVLSGATIQSLENIHFGSARYSPENGWRYKVLSR